MLFKFKFLHLVMECTTSTDQVIKQHYLKFTLSQILWAVDIVSSNEVVFHYRHHL
jgi:hypothetical protein